jgi:hypothetical protein
MNMFGDSTIETILTLAQNFFNEQAQDRIADARREIRTVQAQKRFVARVIAAYRKSIADAEKRAKKQQQSWKRAQRKAAKLGDRMRAGLPLVTAMKG